MDQPPPKAEPATAGRQAGDGLRCPAETHLTVWKQADNKPPPPARLPPDWKKQQQNKTVSKVGERQISDSGGLMKVGVSGHLPLRRHSSDLSSPTRGIAAETPGFVIATLEV